MFINPLSFSSNTHIGLDESVRKVLSNLGYSQEMLNGFDHHSTIELNFNEDKKIRLSVQDDRIWIWSQLQVTEYRFLSRSSEIIPILTSSIEYIETKQLVLGQFDGGYELKALICPSHLDNPSHFESVIASFYEKLSDILSILSDRS